MNPKFFLSLLDRLKVNPKQALAIVLSTLLLVSILGVFAYRKHQVSQNVRQKCYRYMEAQDLPYFEQREDVAPPEKTKEGWVFRAGVSYVGSKGEILRDYKCLVQNGEVVQVQWSN